VRQKLGGQQSIGPRLPYWLGMIMGYLADFVTKFSGKKFPISSIRVKKFCSDTSFMSKKSDLNGFQAPFTLEQGVRNTLDIEFVHPNPDMDVFYTE
jgi:GlcNAc-P-P-Und epimerase